MSGFLADLSDRVKLRITGADRVRYLNGQVTADVRKLTAATALPACVTTAKGKLCATVFLTHTVDAVLIDADAVLRETLAARLERYIVADDVAIEDITDTVRLLHVTGDDLPAEAAECALAGSAVERFGRPGRDLFVAAGEFEALWSQLRATFPPRDADVLETLRIEAGIPRWGHELTEDTLPPEAGLDRTHIDFHKGCYIGQEVISRIKSVGHVNRELTGFAALSGAPLAAGMQLFPAGERDARPLGTLTSAARSLALKKQIALGYLRRGSSPRDLIARTADTPGAEVPVAVHPLPFTS